MLILTKDDVVGLIDRVIVCLPAVDLDVGTGTNQTAIEVDVSAALIAEVRRGTQDLYYVGKRENVAILQRECADFATMQQQTTNKGWLYQRRIFQDQLRN